MNSFRLVLILFVSVMLTLPTTGFSQTKASDVIDTDTTDALHFAHEEMILIDGPGIDPVPEVQTVIIEVIILAWEHREEIEEGIRDIARSFCEAIRQPFCEQYCAEEYPLAQGACMNGHNGLFGWGAEEGCLDQVGDFCQSL